MCYLVARSGNSYSINQIAISANPNYCHPVTAEVETEEINIYVISRANEKHNETALTIPPKILTIGKLNKNEVITRFGKE